MTFFFYPLFLSTFINFLTISKRFVKWKTKLTSSLIWTFPSDELNLGCYCKKKKNTQQIVAISNSWRYKLLLQFDYGIAKISARLFLINLIKRNPSFQQQQQASKKKEFFLPSTILKVQFLFLYVVDFRTASGAHHQSSLEREAVTSQWLLSLPKSG